MNRKNIHEIVLELMQTDDESPEKQTEYLKEEYDKADRRGKESIDMCFIALCGYSLESLIHKRKSTFDLGRADW